MLNSIVQPNSFRLPYDMAFPIRDSKELKLTLKNPTCTCRDIAQLVSIDGKAKLTKALIISSLLSLLHHMAMLMNFSKTSILTPFLHPSSFRFPHELAFPLMPLGQFQRAQLDPS